MGTPCCLRQLFSQKLTSPRTPSRSIMTTYYILWHWHNYVNKIIAICLKKDTGGPVWICPYPPASVLRRVSAKQMEKEFFENAGPSSLLRRFSTVEEVAAMVVYVASERASATTGAALRVDGGVVRSIV